MKKNSRKKIWKRSICMLVAMYALFQCCFLPQDAEAAFSLDQASDGDMEIWTWDRMDTIKDFSKYNLEKYTKVLLMSVSEYGTYVCGMDSTLYNDRAETYCSKDMYGQFYQLGIQGIFNYDVTTYLYYNTCYHEFDGKALKQVPIAEAQKVDPNIQAGIEHFETTSDVSQLEVSILGGTPGSEIQFRMYKEGKDAKTKAGREIGVHNFEEVYSGTTVQKAEFTDNGVWDKQGLYWSVKFGSTWEGTEWTYDSEKTSDMSIYLFELGQNYKKVKSPENTGYICTNLFDYNSTRYWLNCDGSAVFPEEMGQEFMMNQSRVTGLTIYGGILTGYIPTPIYKIPFYVYFGYGGGANVYKNRTVYAGQVLTVNPCDLGSYVIGTMTIEPGAVLVVEGLLVNSGRINNYGTIIIKKGGIISAPLFTSNPNAGQLYCYGSTQYYENSVTKTKGKGDGGLIIKDGGRLAMNTPLVLYAANLTVDGELSLAQNMICYDNKSTMYWRSGGLIWLGYYYYGFEGMARHNIAAISTIVNTGRINYCLRDHTDSVRYFEVYFGSASESYYQTRLLLTYKIEDLPSNLTIRYEEDLDNYTNFKMLLPQTNETANKYGVSTRLVYNQSDPDYEMFYKTFKMFSYKFRAARNVGDVANTNILNCYKYSNGSYTPVKYTNGMQFGTDMFYSFPWLNWNTGTREVTAKVFP